MTDTDVLRPADARVAVLMCVYYPDEEYLRQQLDSIFGQPHEKLTLWVSDDGGDQRTREWLAEYQAELPAGRMTVVAGPGKGFAANFLSLIGRDEIEADYYAFSDQDDIWEPHKLEHALGKLAAATGEEPARPALYGSRTRLIDEQGDEIGLSVRFEKPPSFRNALVQSLAGGNTMVVNHAAKALIAQVGIPDVVSHDWWMYLLVSGAGGIVIYDPEPQVRYRQHGENLMGANVSLRARLLRLRWLLKNRFRDWNDRNVAALEGVQECLSAENRQTLALFARARNSRLPTRLVLLGKTGIYRQTLTGNLGLVLAAIIKKL